MTNSFNKSKISSAKTNCFIKFNTLIFSVALFFTGCTDISKPVTGDLFVMNTIVQNTVYGRKAEAVIDESNAMLKTLEKELSLYKENSDVDKINKNAGLRAVKVNDYTFDLIEKALEYSESTDGLFDITIAPLTLLWGINSDSPSVPSKEEIDKALELVNYKNVILDKQEKTVMLAKEGMALDLGGIAKGYFCSSIQDIYIKNEIEAAWCSIGGNILTYGIKPNGEKFKLGIRDPNGETASDLFAILYSKDEVIATTGGYERYFEEDGIKYTHVLSTTNGYPAKTDIISATVVAKDGGLADFLSTELYMLGTEKIESYLNHKDFSVIIVDEENKVYVSDAIKADIEIINDDYTLV